MFVLYFLMFNSMAIHAVIVFAISALLIHPATYLLMKVFCVFCKFVSGLVYGFGGICGLVLRVQNDSETD